MNMGGGIYANWNTWDREKQSILHLYVECGGGNPNKQGKINKNKLTETEIKRMAAKGEGVGISEKGKGECSQYCDEFLLAGAQSDYGDRWLVGWPHCKV